MWTDILRDRRGVVVKIEDDIIQSCLWWYRHVMRRGIIPKYERLS